MAPFGTQFNPSAVMMGRSSSSPYLWSGAGSTPPAIRSREVDPSGGGSSATPVPTAPRFPQAGPSLPTPTPPTPAPSGPNVLGAESVRATGTGPYDTAYRQNLASYAGGQYARPGGSLNFNPTDLASFPGQPTGGGSAPVTGMPTTLLDQALGGSGGFSWTPQSQADTVVAGTDIGTLQDWADNWLQSGRGMWGNTQ